MGIQFCESINNLVKLKKTTKSRKRKNGNIYTKQNKPQKRKELPLAKAETKSGLWWRLERTENSAEKERSAVGRD